MKRPTFSTIFIQDWGTFSNETLVCVNVDKAQTLRYMRRTGIKPELIALFKEKPETRAAAFVWTPSETGCTLLWLSTWVGDPDNLDTLVHETNHLIYDISRDKGFKDEAEIQAYQQAYLFSGILEKLTVRRARFKARKSKSKKRKANGNKNP